jgi:hypothetical protein
MSFDPNALDVVEQLANNYLSKSGVPSSPFVQRFKKCSPQVQEAVNAALVAKGMKPYIIRGRGRPRKDSTVSKPVQQTQLVVDKILTEGEQKLYDALSISLNEVRIDKQHLQEFLINVGKIEDDIRQRLCELKGIPYSGPINDPYKGLYKKAHEHSRNNMEEITASETCGCFFCRAIFNAKIPMEWTDKGQTALCPNCGIDAVIGDKAGYELTDEFLRAMFAKWFSVPIRLRAARPVEIPPMEEPVSVLVNEPVVAEQPEQPVPKWQWNEPPAQEFAPPEHLLDDSLSGIGNSLVSLIKDDEG